jgi:hypothetical protein
VIGLATVEEAPLDPTAGSLLFLHHFDDGWNADLGANPVRQVGPNGALLQTDPARSVWPSSGPPGTLYPDGSHPQHARSPAFLSAGNLPASGLLGNHAVLGYWVKHCEQRGIDTAMDFTWLRDGGAGQFQSVDVGHDMRWGILIENRAQGGDLGSERQHHVHLYGSPGPIGALASGFQMRLPGLRWHWVTAHFDTDATTVGLDAFASVQGIEGGGLHAPTAGGNYPNPFSTATENLFAPGQVFVLGSQLQATMAGYGVLVGNQILDEFMICDFGDDASAALSNATVWADGCYARGRYYKGGDGAFTSSALAPGGMGRLLRAFWTGCLPDAARRELPILGLNGTLPAVGVLRTVDPRLAGRCRLELDLLDAAGGTLQPLSQGGRLDRVLPDFGYRVRFVTDLEDPADEPMLETPFFDDITFAWQPLTGPRVLAWTGERSWE